MALTHVDTPLKGGLNTELQNTDFGGITPRKEVITTPNTVLSTPFRSQNSDGNSSKFGLSLINGKIIHKYNTIKKYYIKGRTPGTGFNTPASVGSSSIRGSGILNTPLRDKLNINPEEGLEGGETPLALRQMKEQLRTGLSLLPAPKNDYEIVVPEDEAIEPTQPDSATIEDQADIDARFLADQKAKRMLELKKKLFITVILQIFKIL